MPAKYFLFENGDRYLVKDVLEEKSFMPGFPLPYLKAIGAEREWDGNLHVTDLYNGLRQTFLKYVVDYAIDPDDSAFAVSGNLKHDKLEEFGDMSELAVFYKGIKGRTDLLDYEKHNGYVLTDYKNQGAFAVRKFMGWQKRMVPVLDEYGVQVFLKSGKNKGAPKMQSEWFFDPKTAETEQYDYQLNIYRKAIEETFKIEVVDMRIFFMLRDGGLAATREAGLNRNTYLLPVKRLSDDVIDAYIEERSVTKPLIETTLDENRGTTEIVTPALIKNCPGMCTEKERWYDPASGISKKCEFYCPVRHICQEIGG